MKDWTIRQILEAVEGHGKYHTSSYDGSVLTVDDALVELKKRLPEKPHDYDKWAEHIRLGYDWAIEAMAKELE